MELVDLLQHYFYLYGPIALLPLLMVEGPLMAIAGGFLVGSGSISLWTMFIAYLLADGIMSHVYFFAGSSSRKFFKSIRLRFYQVAQSNNRQPTIVYLEKKLQENFDLTYSIAKFIPIPYSTITATIISGGLGVKYRHFLRLILYLVPLQGVVFISIGYLVAEGVLNSITPERIFGLVSVVLLFMLAIYYRQSIMKAISQGVYSNNDTQK